MSAQHFRSRARRPACRSFRRSLNFASRSSNARCAGGPTLGSGTGHGSDQDHRIAADDLALGSLPKPEDLCFPRPEVADARVEVDAKRAASARETFFWAKERPPRLVGEAVQREPPRLGNGGRKE